MSIMDWPALWHEAALLLGRWWPTLHPRSGCDRCLLGSAGCGVVFKTWFRLRWQIPCGAVTTRSNFSEILLTDIPFARPLGWDVGCLLWVLTLIYISSQPLYLCLQYHAILVRVVAALDCISFALNRIIHVPRWTKGGDQSMWITFHLCSMPNLIYEYYAASLLYRAKFYVIRIIFIIFHICATLPSPELHLTEMVCFQCFICLYVFHILFTDFRLFVFMFDSRRFLNWDRHPAFFVILYHDRRWTGRRVIFW